MPADNQLPGTSAEMIDRLLRATRRRNESLRRAHAALAECLQDAVRKLVKPGTLLSRRDRQFGDISIYTGNARGALEFEVASVPVLSSVDLRHPELTHFTVEAHPVNASGKVMSGRAGNWSYAGVRGKDTLTLHVRVCGHISLDETRSADELLMEVVARAAAVEA